MYPSYAESQELTSDSYSRTTIVAYASPETTLSEALQSTRLNDIDEYELYILKKESGLRTNAKNPHSTAFGMYQMIKSNRVYYGKVFGINPDTTNREEQMKMGRAYILDRYGSMKSAYLFHISHGWY